MMESPTMISNTGTEEQESQEERKREREFNEAVDRVWQRYGRDLGAFQRDVQRELEKCVEEKPED